MTNVLPFSTFLRKSHDATAVLKKLINMKTFTKSKGIYGLLLRRIYLHERLETFQSRVQCHVCSRDHFPTIFLGQVCPEIDLCFKGLFYFGMNYFVLNSKISVNNIIATLFWVIWNCVPNSICTDDDNGYHRVVM